jgi:hypothetical protein
MHVHSMQLCFARLSPVDYEKHPALAHVPGSEFLLDIALTKSIIQCPFMPDTWWNIIQILLN